MGGIGDLCVALTVFPWLFVLGYFVFIFLEWSGRSKGEDHVYARLLGERKIHEGRGDR